MVGRYEESDAARHRTDEARAPKHPCNFTCQSPAKFRLASRLASCIRL